MTGMVDNRIRVLFAIPALDRGGPDRVLFELLCSIDRTKFVPSLMVIDGEGDYIKRLPADIPVEVLGGKSRRDRYPVLRALQFIRKTKPDVVFGTLRMTFTLGIASPAFPASTRLVLRQANDFTTDFALLVAKSPVKHRFARWLSKQNLKRADAVVCQSHAMKHDLGALIGTSGNLHVISNPVDLEAVARAGNSTLPGTPALVSVGRLAPQKGFDILLPAIAKLRARHPGLHLTIIGEGPDRVALEAQAIQLGLADVVTFTGFSSNPIPQVRAADLFVLSSRYEGFPNAALEALACGTPVVLTDCPGANSEIVIGGMNGRLAPSIDATAFADAMETALAELASYDRTAIIANCAERYAARRIVEQYQHLFSSVVRS
ncbi:MAG: glycosyltransferase [Kofleriaceae bacterium]